MKKLLILIFTFIISACASNSVQTVVISENLLTRCPKLKSIDPNSTIELQSKIIVDNYNLYHQCSDKNKALIDLYIKEHGLTEKK